MKRSINVSWDAPLDDGGRPISQYVVEFDAADGTFEQIATARCEGVREDIVSIILIHFRF